MPRRTLSLLGALLLRTSLPKLYPFSPPAYPFQHVRYLRNRRILDFQSSSREIRRGELKEGRLVSEFSVIEKENIKGVADTEDRPFRTGEPAFMAKHHPSEEEKEHHHGKIQEHALPFETKRMHKRSNP